MIFVNCIFLTLNGYAPNQCCDRLQPSTAINLATNDEPSKWWFWGLAIGIADTNFDEFEHKSTLKAAFVITQKTLREFEVERAREFWEMGPESIELFDGYISDDYEFAPE